MKKMERFLDQLLYQLFQSVKKFAGTTEKMSDVGSKKEPLTGYRFIDLAGLANVFSLVACPKCGYTLTLSMETYLLDN